MTKENKEEMIWDALDELDWNDSRVPEIMEDFFGTPADACSKADGEMSENHIDELFSLLELEEKEVK